MIDTNWLFMKIEYMLIHITRSTPGMIRGVMCGFNTKFLEAVKAGKSMIRGVMCGFLCINTEAVYQKMKYSMIVYVK